jgi:hypothetical protein
MQVWRAGGVCASRAVGFRFRAASSPRGELLGDAEGFEGNELAWDVLMRVGAYARGRELPLPAPVLWQMQFTCKYC